MFIGTKIIGPNIEEIPNTIEYIAIALDNSFCFTNAGSIADLDGRSKDRRIPVSTDINNNIEGVINSIEIVIPVINANKENNPLVNLMLINLLTLSAITPPKNEKIIIGDNVQNPTNPTIIVDSVRSCINHNLPYPNDHIPIFENAAANQKYLYSLDSKACRPVFEERKSFKFVNKIIFKIRCRRAESNRRHMDFQSIALPTELPRQKLNRFKEFTTFLQYLV